MLKFRHVRIAGCNLEVRTGETKPAAPKDPKALARKKLIEALPSNFDRHQKGDTLIKQEMQRLLECHRATGSILTDEQRVRLKDPVSGQTYVGLTWSQILERAPSYFSKLYQKIRNKEEYGRVVHGHFIQMNKNRAVTRLVKDPLRSFAYYVFSCLSKLNSLILLPP